MGTYRSPTSTDHSFPLGADGGAFRLPSEMEGHLPRSFYISISIHSHTLIAIWIWPITRLLKDLRIPLFPFLRLNDVVSDRVSSLLTFYLSRLYRLLYVRPLHMSLHRAGRWGGPGDNLHLLLPPTDREAPRLPSPHPIKILPLLLFSTSTTCPHRITASSRFDALQTRP